VAAAVASGIVVLFSAGNGGWGFPSQHPDVIAVGGVFMDRDGSMRASNYSSGFISNIYPGRRVPDVSGLVGQLPQGIYIMLPVPEGSTLDAGLAGGSFPNGDETPGNDGWAAFSGTSASCPQVAGVCALIKEACARLDPFEIRDILMSTARDVTTGTNHPNFGNAATVGPDTATGNGLVDAHRAVLVAKLRCMTLPLVPLPFTPILPTFPLHPAIPFTPVHPAIPTLPFAPLHPAIPLTPVQPTLPFAPLHPAIPTLPFAPLAPAIPLQPFRPLAPLAPLPPIRPFAPFGPRPGGGTLSAEDVAELERMIIESEEDPTGS
jgi:hypothetical protein